MKPYKLIFLDLDGTLINTISGKTFPIGVWDMKLNLPLLDSIKLIKPDYIFIVTNQGGIEKGFVNEYHFRNKIKYILNSIVEYLGYNCNCKACYCSSNDKNDVNRKPNTGMLNFIIENNIYNSAQVVTKEQMCMIGDASGKEGQFSDSDKQTAINFGIDYFDVSDFINSDGFIEH